MLNKKLQRCLLVIISCMIAITFAGCSGDGMKQKKGGYKSLKDVPDAAWAKLSKKKIYFGHQSVGYNIMEGIKELMKQYPQIKLNIVETRDSKAFDSKGIFAHSTIGENGHPESKLKDFRNILESGAGENLNFAAMKFCFVDVTSKTDINHLFAQYKKNNIDLEHEFPNIKFIHFTVPLLRRNTGIIMWVKRIIGKDNGFFSDDNNIARNKFNDLIRQDYSGREPVFDLAKFESTYPDGKRCAFTRDGKTYYSLVPEYTKDGGHLNKLGRKQVAEQFLLLLANID